MRSLVEYFGCGKYRERKNRLTGDFEITNYNDITNVIIPYFKKYPILGIKNKDFEDFCKVAELMQNKAHLTEEGLIQIRQIKAGMNKGSGNSLYKKKKNSAGEILSIYYVQHCLQNEIIFRPYGLRMVKK